MKFKILMTALAVCLLMVSAGCQSDGSGFDPTSMLDPAGESASDGSFLMNDLDGFEKSGDGDDDDDDHGCDGSDPYDEEMFPDGDGDDDDDDDCRPVD